MEIKQEGSRPRRIVVRSKVTPTSTTGELKESKYKGGTMEVGKIARTQLQGILRRNPRYTSTSTTTITTTTPPPPTATTTSTTCPPTTKKIQHKFATVVRMKFTVAHEESPSEVIPRLLGDFLDTLQRLDRDARYLHLTNEESQVGSRSQLPDLATIFNEWAYFGSVPFIKLRDMKQPCKGRFRTYTCSMTVGTNEDLDKAIKYCTVEWNKTRMRDTRVNVEIKPIQEVKTEKAIILVGVPTLLCDPIALTKKMVKFMGEALERMRTANPQHYEHITTLPTFALVPEFIQNIPFAPHDRKESGIPVWAEKPFHIESRPDDVDTLLAILYYMLRVEDSMWRICAGAYAFDNRDIRTLDDVELLKEIRALHIAAMRETGHINVQGLLTPDKVVKMKQFGQREDGSKYVKKEHLLSFRDVIRKIKNRGVQVFQFLATTDEGTFALYHMTGDRHAWMQEMIGEFTSSPAGYIRLWLARRGFDNNDIHKLIKQSFSNLKSEATREAQIIAGHVIDGHIVSRQVSVRENIEVSHLELAQIVALPPDLFGKEFNVIDGLQVSVLYYITLAVLSTIIVLAVLMVGWLLWKERWKSIL